MHGQKVKRTMRAAAPVSKFGLSKNKQQEILQITGRKSKKKS